MNIMRKAISTFAGISLAVLLFAALAPKATRGVAAALVQVTNTGASPVPVEDHARQAVLLFINAATVFPASEIPFTNIVGSPFTIPANKRLVIEQISGQLALPAGSFPNLVALTGTLGGTRGFEYNANLTTPTETVFGNASQDSEFVFSQSWRLYSDPPPSLVFGIFSGSPGNLVAVATGYLVDCTGACPPQE